MDRVPQRVERWWDTLDDPARRRVSVLVLICAAYVAHYLVYCFAQPFYIEDSAITYAYARFLVEGDGLVGYQGGERVEGYSNALWTFLLAGFYALGVPLWTAAKLLGGILSTATLPLVYRVARRAMPTQRPEAALLAPALVAASVQFVLWSTAGLENSLLCFLLMAGFDRLLVETDRLDRGLRPFPWSALLFFLVSMTRPEGVAYAAFAGVALALDAVRNRRFAHLAAWAAVFTVPLIAYNAWRYSYFGWAFPNTYYAKLGRGTTFKPYNWTTKGWKYINAWFVKHGVLFLMPLVVMALTGLRSRARWFGVLVLGWLSVVILWDGSVDWKALGVDATPQAWRELQSSWVKLRVWSIAIAAASLGLATLSRPGWRARGLLWISCSFGVFFALYAGGDWMAQHRWFNTVAVTMLPLMAVGLTELVSTAVPEGARTPWPGRGVPIRPALLFVVFAAWLSGEARHDWRFANSPDTSPRDVHRRVSHMATVQRALDLDNVTLLDVDMGAHMYFSGWDIVDIAGLVDVSMARHSDFNKKFIREYIFEQRKPHFAHVHGGWASSSKIPTHPEWRREYISVDSYPIGGARLHNGNHVRKDTFVQTKLRAEWPEGARAVGKKLHLISVDVSAPEVAQGTAVMLETVWQSDHHIGDIQCIAFLANDEGVVHSSAFEPGFGWYPTRQWKVNEWVDGRHELVLPERLEPGEYRLGIVVLDAASGEVLPIEGARDGDPLYADGELILDDTVSIVTLDEATAEAEQDLRVALDASAEGRCADVWPAWKRARRHLLDAPAWVQSHDFDVRQALAGCFVRSAIEEEFVEDEAALLIEARVWYRHHPDLVPLARLRAQEFVERGDVAFAEQDWEHAQELYETALALDPRLSHIRRKAEDARDYKLRIVRPGRTKADLPPLDGEEDELDEFFDVDPPDVDNGVEDDEDADEQG